MPGCLPSSRRRCRCAARGRCDGRPAQRTRRRRHSGERQAAHRAAQGQRVRRDDRDHRRGRSRRGEHRRVRARAARPPAPRHRRAARRASAPCVSASSPPRGRRGECERDEARRRGGTRGRLRRVRQQADQHANADPHAGQPARPPEGVMSAPILVIEDNPITSKQMRYTLEAGHHEVVVAADCASGLASVRERRPVLILLDLLLPDGDGFELLGQLRALPNASDVPILALSGILSPHDEARLSKVGFDDRVSKPIDPSRLLQVVKAYLPPAEAPSARAAPTAGGTRTLVLADDDAVQRKLVALRLQRAGFQVTTAADGQEAFERARSVKPYAIVSDVLMPRLDGFGLCIAVRNDPVLAQTPVLLISNSYLDTEDRTLARRAGADELLVRTPELNDVIAALHSDLASTRGAQAGPPSLDPRLEHDHLCRALNQLERQVAQQAGLAQRCSLLSAELSVLSGISEAVATEHDIEGALHQILATCLDAGGVALGVLYLVDPDGMRGIPFGALERCAGDDIAAFFGHRELLDSAIASQTLICVPSRPAPEDRHRTLLERTT